MAFTNIYTHILLPDHIQAIAFMSPYPQINILFETSLPTKTLVILFFCLICSPEYILAKLLHVLVVY